MGTPTEKYKDLLETDEVEEATELPNKEGENELGGTRRRLQQKTEESSEISEAEFADALDTVNDNTSEEDLMALLDALEDELDGLSEVDSEVEESIKID